MEPVRSLTDELPVAQRQMALLSHDLLSALAGITGGLRQINADRLESADRLQLDRVMQESVILAELLDSALQIDLSPASPGGSENPCDIDCFLQEQAKRWRAQAEEKSILWSMVLRRPLPANVRMSELRLARAIGNVVNNAIKYTDYGAVELLAEVSNAGALEITVIDNGPGFTDAALAQVFEFYGRPENSAKPGTGLGLHIAKTLLEQVGASISIRNRDGVGARVSITIPEFLCSANAGPEPAITRKKLPDLTGFKILLAEDNKTNQMVAAQMLQSMNAEVTVASDGYEALLKFEKARFDLALLDIEMPRMSGLDVLRAIRGRGDERAKTPLVALTAYAMREHKERIAAAGANGLIPKPLISIEEFGHSLLSYLAVDTAANDRNVSASPPPTGTNASGVVIDPEIYASLLATIGNESMGELLDKIAEDVSEVKRGITAGSARRDAQLVRSSTHVLISVAGAVGATALQGLAERLNAAAHNGNDVAIAELSAQCISQITSAEAFLGRERERFRPGQ